MTETIRTHLPSRHTVAVTIAAVAALAVGVAAFGRSFSALSHLATMHGWPADQAWILPTVLDGMIVVPTVATVVLNGKAGRGYAWSLLVAGTVLSVAGNGVHAWLTTASTVAVALAVIPPVALLAAVHLTIVIARQEQDATTVPVAAVATPTETPTPEPSDIEVVEVPRLRVAPEPVSQPAATSVVAETRVAPADVDELREKALKLVAEGMSRRAIAEKLEVSKDRVQRWATQHAASLAASAPTAATG